MSVKKLEQYHIILASQSPRRKELLGRLHIPFEVLAANGEEKIQDGASMPADTAMNLARQKAEEVYTLKQAECRCTEQPLLVIGADTIVVFQGQILGKPQCREHACEMLHMLSGNMHQVITGVCMIQEIHASRMEKYCFYEMTEVTFMHLTDGEIQEYVDSGDSDDKAGGYGIQGDFSRYVQGIRGDYNTVVGLPLARIYRQLKEMPL